MSIDGMVLFSEAEVSPGVSFFFKQLFSTDQVACCDCDWERLDFPHSWNSPALIKHVSLEELKKAVFSSKASSAPGPDGFPIPFFQRYWEIINIDLLKLVNFFFAGDCRLHSINHSWIILLLKVSSPSSIKDYRPICLSNCLKDNLQDSFANTFGGY